MIQQPAAAESASGAPPLATILSMQHITKRFPGVVALDDVSFDVRPGEVHALVGENGAGKSTLMNIMSGTYADYEGELLLNGEPVKFHNPRDAQNAGVVMIHQELNLVPELTVFENIFLGREHVSFGIVNRGSMRRTAQKLLSDLGLDIDPSRPVNRLRVGQRQLVEIAKALNLNSRVIIMDEPTSALSETEVEYLFEVTRALRERNVAVIYISHRLDEIFSIADRITVLRDGRVAGSALAQDMTRQQLINLMVGRNLDVLYPKLEAPLGETVLRVKDLTLQAGRTKILNDISLEVRQGEIVGLAGLMGAGRTQLLETVFGVYPQSQLRGSMWFEGKETRIKSPKEAIARGIGLVTEDRKGQSLVLGQSVTENATLAALREFLYFLNIINQPAERKAVSRVVSDLNIKTPSISTMVANLSGGNQQKVVIAKFLLAHIKLFLLDEPTRGIDVGAKAEVYTLIGELAKRGTGFLLVSSELPELLAVSDRIYVLCDGRLTGEFARDEFDQAAIMEAATRFANGNHDEQPEPEETGI